MSAFVIERAAIDALARFACQRETVWTDQTAEGKYRYLEMSDADWLGRELWNENVVSVAYRYDDADDLPAEEGFTPETALDYTLPTSAWMRPAASAASILKTADCLEYQSCEHPGWETSRAKKLLDAIRSVAWRRVPGYEEANWGAPEGFAYGECEVI